MKNFLKLSNLLFLVVFVCCILNSTYAQDKTFTNSIGMEFVLIPAGTFMMGTEFPKLNCPQDDPFTKKNEYDDCYWSSIEKSGVHLVETPKHKVSISKPFYMAKHEVTQLQWYTVMGNNPSYFKSETVGIDSRHHPVDSVKCEDAQEFIHRLNKREGINAYRLPTEAEWEYAARAGTTTKYYFGDDGNLNEHAWNSYNSKGKTHPVGQLQPNPWGLYDMYGNVTEYCLDWYGYEYFSQSPEIDPQGPSPSSSGHVNKGCAFSFERDCHSAVRMPTYGGLAREINGFRIIKEVRN